jgi:hypothetical protein
MFKDESVCKDAVYAGALEVSAEKAEDEVNEATEKELNQAQSADQMALLQTTPRCLSIDRALKDLWTRLKSKYSATDLVLGGTFGIHTVVYWSLGLGLLALDKFAPKLVDRYKTQPTEIVRRSQLIKLFKVVVKNQTLTLAFLVFIRKMKFKITEKKFQEMVDTPVPGIARICAELVWHVMIDEVFFLLDPQVAASQEIVQIHPQAAS